MLFYFVTLYLFLGQLKPRIKDLQTIVVPHVAADWYGIGIALLNNKDVPKLKEIQVDYPSYSQKCCIKMLQYWLEVTPSATWNDLIETLSSKLQLVAASEKIKRQLKG